MPDSVNDPALADPMLRELRHRHPDVDVVLLPPQTAAHPPLAGPDRVRSLRSHLEAVLSTVSRQLGLEPERTAAHWWQQAHPLCHRRVVRAGFAEEADGRTPADLLRATAEALVALGWDVRPAADRSHRLRAVAGPIELVAECTPDALAVRLTSEPVWAATETLEDRAGAS